MKKCHVFGVIDKKGGILYPCNIGKCRCDEVTHGGQYCDIKMRAVYTIEKFDTPAFYDIPVYLACTPYNKNALHKTGVLGSFDSRKECEKFIKTLQHYAHVFEMPRRIAR